MKVNEVVRHSYVFDRNELVKILGLKGKIISAFGSAINTSTTVEILTEEQVKP